MHLGLVTCLLLLFVVCEWPCLCALTAPFIAISRFFSPLYSASGSAMFVVCGAKRVFSSLTTMTTTHPLRRPAINRIVLATVKWNYVEKLATADWCATTIDCRLLTTGNSLTNGGCIAHTIAISLANSKFGIFRQSSGNGNCAIQRIVDQFDVSVNQSNRKWRTHAREARSPCQRLFGK